MSEQLVSKSVGIDLGTTNSAVAVMNPADTDVLIHRDERTKAQTTPSCVWKDPRTGEVVVGMRAFRRLGTTPEPVRSIKRRMGLRERVLLTDEERTPEEISADILRELREQIQRDVSGWNSTRATWVVDRGIVTVPAYFDHTSIEATRRAAELAGIEVVDLLHEPTAAAAYHCWSKRIDNGVFLVYDLGGGTFDVSVVRCAAGNFEVLGISGNNRLGGDNIDDLIAGHLRQLLAADGYALDLDLHGNPEDRIRFNQLRFLAEGVKKALSQQTEFMLSDQNTLRDQQGNVVAISTMVERTELDDIMRPVVERTLPYCLEAVDLAGKKAGITLADVDQVILAGGSTHIPLVRDMVTAALCGPGRAKATEPVYEKVDTIVALGAAVRAASVGGLTVSNASRTVRVAFKGIGSTGAATARVGGTVTSTDPGVDLVGGQVRVLTDDHDDDTDIGPGGLFTLAGIPLQRDAENTLRFEIYDRGGALAAAVDRSVTQSATHSATTGIGSPARVAKAFLLEVSHGGRPYLKELVPALADLPVSEDFTFLHPGDTDTVVFSMYQKRRKIQVLRVPVPASTPRGVPIKLNVSIDELSYITVRGSIGDVEFGIPVEAPADRTVPTDDDVRQLKTKLQEASEYLPPGARAVIAAKARKAEERLKAAADLADPGQVIHEFEEFETLLDEASGLHSTLEPPKKVFDELVEMCREIIAFLAGGERDESRPFDAVETRRSVDALRVQGETAFRTANQRAYGEAIQMLEGIRANLVAIYHRDRDAVDHRTDGERAEELVAEAIKDARTLQHLAAAKQRHDIAEETIAIEAELTALAATAHQDPRKVETRTGQLRARLNQLSHVVTGKATGYGDIPVDTQGSGR